MIKKVSIRLCQSFIFGGLAIVDVAGEEICIDFDVATGGPELIVLVGGRGKANKVEESVAAHFEEELLELLTNITCCNESATISFPLKKSNREVL
ncbi:hypothetical protein MT997_04245 [Paenibacillus sp. OVF10]|nr:hypothetical protein MT997_04245 [Paenibacillus sp. OVF10]